VRNFYQGIIFFMPFFLLEDSLVESCLHSGLLSFEVQGGVGVAFAGVCALPVAGAGAVLLLLLDDVLDDSPVAPAVVVGGGAVDVTGAADVGGAVTGGALVVAG
jgi:hypothetical protein